MNKEYEKEFIAGRFHEFKPGAISVWIMPSDAKKVVRQDGSIAFTIMKKKNLSAKNSHFGYVSKVKQGGQVADNQNQERQYPPPADTPQCQNWAGDVDDEGNIPF